MDYSRRDLALLLPLLAAGSAVAAQQTNAPSAPSAPTAPAAPSAPRGRGANTPPQVLTTKAIKYADLKPSGTGARTLASIINGVTTRGLRLEMHLSDLGPGLQPHPPHQNVREEILIVIEGMLDVELFGKHPEFGLPPEKGGGQVTRLEEGGVAYLGSNDMHGWRNPGTTTCRYMVLTIG